MGKNYFLDSILSQAKSIYSKEIRGGKKLVGGSLDFNNIDNFMKSVAQLIKKPTSESDSALAIVAVAAASLLGSDNMQNEVKLIEPIETKETIEINEFSIIINKARSLSEKLKQLQSVNNDILREGKEKGKIILGKLGKKGAVIVNTIENNHDIPQEYFI
jgi:hypothetical protein